MKKEALRDHLFRFCRGREHTAGSRDLEQTLGTSENELRKQVNRLRRDSVPIASDRNGYFYARTAGEVYTTIQSLKSMRAGLDAAITGLERALNDFGPGGEARHG